MIPFGLKGLLNRSSSILPRTGGSTLDTAIMVAGTVSKINEYLERNEGNKEPQAGAMVYCMLGPVEHSGIYIGYDRIVHLNGKGDIEVVTTEKFTDHITTFNKSILVPLDKDGNAIGCKEVALRAISMIGTSRNYNILLDNCHQFSVGCITDDFETAGNYLWWVKDEFERKVEKSCRWGRWDWELGEGISTSTRPGIFF
ncbi:hypothetical protein HNV23_08820 [Bacillus paranthracis]|uniref:lecithin retinol acyltransferase family protein n=1 Tax=Bacillus paranthracis TaxID=2026186 RepID=UPI00148F3DD9|nr:lecithin retinol acyltransferase family protein [Bacillus paranthracis]NOP79586.1 hypothetical protein [Bacillus paranthracis]